MSYLVDSENNTEKYLSFYKKNKNEIIKQINPKNTCKVIDNEFLLHCIQQAHEEVFKNGRYYSIGRINQIYENDYNALCHDDMILDDGGDYTYCNDYYEKERQMKYLEEKLIECEDELNNVYTEIDKELIDITTQLYLGLRPHTTLSRGC